MRGSRNQENHSARTSITCKRLVIVQTLLLALSACQVFAQVAKDDFKFVNVADNTQDLIGFLNFPAINNRGDVAFVATGNDRVQGVFKWHQGRVTTIAKSSSVLGGFGDDVVINAAGVVGYDASVASASVNDRAIFTSNGVWTRTIFDAGQQGFAGRFMGSPSINAAGTVAFFATRPNFSQVLLTGDGGPLTTIADTNDQTFGGFGNAAINSSGEITFSASRADGSMGVFMATPANEDDRPSATPATIIALTDAQNPLFSDPFASFGDPVINEAGTVADVGFPGFGNLEIFTGNGHSVTARTDPNSSFFTASEHPSLNDRGAVAFYANELGGGQGIFVELTGGTSPMAVIEAGDRLFGSTVTRLDLGRFALNDRGQLAFRYDLQDGRSGVAIASPRKRNKEEGESER